MSVEAVITEDAVTIAVAGRMDYSCADAFRTACRDLPESVRRFEVDLAETEFIDSSGLGMLIDLKRTAGERLVHISRCAPHVRRILMISHFDRRFEIG